VLRRCAIDKPPVPVAAADVMTPGEGTEPVEFYAACREPDLAVRATALHCCWRQAGVESLPHGSR